jgi:hypothetical protein
MCYRKPVQNRKTARFLGINYKQVSFRSKHKQKDNIKMELKLDERVWNVFIWLSIGTTDELL